MSATVLSARTRLLLEGPPLPTLLRLAAPNVGEAAARVTFISADALFVSWLGVDALAGVSLVFPLFLLMQMMSAGGLGVGVASAVARALGAGTRREADALAGHGLILAVALAASATVAMLLSGPWLYAELGAKGAALDAAVAYSAWMFGGIVLVWLMNTLANVFRGAGDMATAASSIVVGEAMHLLLSPALILGWGPFPELGVVGAAIGALSAYATGAAMLLFRLGGGAVRPRFDGIRMARFGAVLKVGAFGALNVMQMQVIAFVATSLVAGFGAATLAGFGAALRLEILQIPILFGVGSAVIAMVATSLGAGDRMRGRRVASTGALVSTGIGLVFAAIALLCPEAWLRLFTADADAIAAGAAYLRSNGWVYPLLGFGTALMFACLGAGQGLRASLPLSVRLAVVVVGGSATLGLGFGRDALFFCMAAATAAFCGAMLVAVRPQFARES
jgi:putative MATE family efflux protein